MTIHKIRHTTFVLKMPDTLHGTQSTVLLHHKNSSGLGFLACKHPRTPI